VAGLSPRHPRVVVMTKLWPPWTQDRRAVPPVITGGVDRFRPADIRRVPDHLAVAVALDDAGRTLRERQTGLPSAETRDRLSSYLMAATWFRGDRPVVQPRLDDDDGGPDKRDGEADGVGLIGGADVERRLGSFDRNERRLPTGGVVPAWSARGA